MAAKLPGSDMWVIKNVESGRLKGAFPGRECSGGGVNFRPLMRFGLTETRRTQGIIMVMIAFFIGSSRHVSEGIWMQAGW